MTREIRTTSAAETKSWGKRLARLLPPGAVIGLEGELGAGKTCFVKGLAVGLGINEEEITSPTFTLIAEHYRGRVPLYHIDLYRLEGAEVEELGIDEYLFSRGVSAIEWFRFLPVGMVDEYLLVSFTFVNEDERVLRLTARGEQYEKIVQALLGEGLGVRAWKDKDHMLVVQKYGGTSVGSVERIKEVAKRVAATRDAGHQVAVVVSAMSGETNRLLSLARQIAAQPDERERDVLVSTGEQVSVALLAMALKEMGYRAFSLLGHQVQISTDSAFGRARIKHINTERILSALRDGHIVVIAGFQGVDAGDNITTLGRGGSDTTAVAIAAAVKAEVCEIHTDVDGVYSADPRICPHARKLSRISYDEMLELASLGAKVLQIRSVELAKRYQVPVHVRSSFSPDEGTWLVQEDCSMEEVIVSGVTSDLDQAKITLLRVPDRPGLAAKLFSPIADDNIVVDMIIQNASADGFTDLTFTVPKGDAPKALAKVKAAAPEIGADGVVFDAEVAKVSIVGLGMRSHAGVAARMFQTLAREGINIQMISTSEIKISVVIDAKYTELAVRVLHDTFIPPVK